MTTEPNWNREEKIGLAAEATIGTILVGFAAAAGVDAGQISATTAFIATAVSGPSYYGFIRNAHLIPVVRNLG